LFQFLVPQVLNPSLLASSQARWAPLSFLPDVLAFLFLLINPLLISMSFPLVIIDFIYFYAPTVTGMHPSNSFIDGSAIESFYIQYTYHCIQGNCSNWGASNPRSSSA
jgi:hypothetical protein